MFNSAFYTSTYIFISFFVNNYCDGARRDPLVTPGKYCDPDIYNRLVKPSSEAVDELLQENQASKVLDDLSEIIRKLMTAVNNEIDVPGDADERTKNFASKNLLASKACSGLGAVYLTCDPDRSVCVCKTYFPFNSTTRRGQCEPVLGSICSVGDDFELPCSDGMVCTGDDVGNTRYCGGIAEFQQQQEEAKARQAAGAIGVLTSIPIIFVMTVLTFLIAAANNVH